MLILICHSRPELECSIVAYFFHHHAIMSQNSSSPPSRIKLVKNWVQTEHFYVHGSSQYDFIFFTIPPTSSNGLEMVVTAALINWVEVCWSATGDPGTVIKLGQCQTLQPWLSLFLHENSILSYINPISLFICMLRPFVFARPLHRFPLAPSAGMIPQEGARKPKFYIYSTSKLTTYMYIFIYSIYCSRCMWMH